MTITPPAIPFPPMPHTGELETCTGYCREVAEWRIAEREAAIARERVEAAGGGIGMMAEEYEDLIRRAVKALERIVKRLETPHKDEMTVMEMHPLAGTPDFERGRKHMCKHGAYPPCGKCRGEAPR